MGSRLRLVAVQTEKAALRPDVLGIMLAGDQIHNVAIIDAVEGTGAQR